MKKIVYITGCLGFIGSYVTQRCLDMGWYVRGIDKCTYASDETALKLFNKDDNFEFEKVDINDMTHLYECDYIINIAAETHVDNSIMQSNEFIHSNISGVYNLLQLMRSKTNFKMPTLIHFSTDEVYGDTKNKDEYFTENAELKPSNPYSATKAAADMLVLAWARTYGIPYVIVRPTNNYGIGQYIEKLIPKSCKYLELDKKIPLHNFGTPMRTWLHVDDTVDAIMTIIKSEVENEIFNISGNVEHSNLNVVDKIVRKWYPDELVDVSTKVDFTYNRSGQDVRYGINDKKLRSLGWNPTRNFDEELADIIHYHQMRGFIW